MGQKAPGKEPPRRHHLIELAEMFPDEATATAWFEALIWPDHLRRTGIGWVNVRNEGGEAYAKSLRRGH